MRLITLRSAVLTLVLICLMGPDGPSPIAAQEIVPATLVGTPTPFTGETFVGRTSDPDTFVAVVVAEPAGDGGERQARAYLCNATTIDAWLTGTLTGDRLDLRAEDEAWMKAALGDHGVEGTAALADGTIVSFTAQPATGFAGLYTVTIDADGRLHGVSSRDDELTGRVEPAPGLRLVMTLTAAEGETTHIEAATTVAAEGAFRLIVLEDGQARGRGKTKDGQGFIDPTTDI